MHFDVKADNILFGLHNEVPLLIDFGLSIPMQELDQSNRRKYFYTYVPEYVVWPLEVHILNYMLHVEKGPLTTSGLKSVCERVAKAQPSLDDYSGRKAYTEACVRAMKPHVGKSLDEAFPRLISAWATWDNYALGILFGHYLRLATKGVTERNVLLRGIAQIITEATDPDPGARLSVAATSKRLRSITLRGRGHAQAMRLYRGQDIVAASRPSL